MPVFNGLVFDSSRAELRAFNTNLGFQMFQGGFFLGPFLGGPVVLHWGYAALFHVSACLSVIAAGVVFYLKWKRRPRGESGT